MISTSALLTLALATAGQHCGYGYGYGYQNYTYVYPTYVQPAYYYQQPVAYVQPTYQVKTKVVAVEHYNEEYADLAGTYERAERRAEAKLKEKQELEKRFDTLTQAIERLAAGQAPVQAAPQSAQAPAPTPTPAYPSFQRPVAAPQQAIPPSKGYPLPPAKSPGDYSPSVQPLDYAAPSPPPAQVTSLGGVVGPPSVLNRCAACHTGATSRGGFVMFDAPGQVANLTVADLQLADDAVASGRMPKGGPPLSLAEYREFGSWLRSISGQAAEPVASTPVARNPF